MSSWGIRGIVLGSAFVRWSLIALAASAFFVYLASLEHLSVRSR
jgi:hypothetical protein